MRRFAAGFVSVLSVALLAGCAQQGSSSVTVSGKSLTLYISSPVGAAASDPVAQDVIDAEELAFSDHQGEVSGFTLNLKVLHGAKLSDNARTAISDTHAIAYLGEILPGDSADSLGITNDQSLLQVTPTDTAVELTQSSSAVPGIAGQLLRGAQELRPDVHPRRPDLRQGGEGAGLGDAVARRQAALYRQRRQRLRQGDRGRAARRCLRCRDHRRLLGVGCRRGVPRRPHPGRVCRASCAPTQR